MKIEKPGIDFIKRLYSRLLRKAGFNGSKVYWEERYAGGGTSGSGSYGRLADFKAQVLNNFVKENNTLSVIEFGCGDGNQLSLSHYPLYIGVDASKSAVEFCKSKFRNDSTKQFYVADTTPNRYKAELALSLDVLYHLVEDNVFEGYMHNLFASAEKHVIVYSSNFESDQNQHEKTRAFTQWGQQSMKNWELVSMIENPYKYDPLDPENTSLSDFYFYKKKQ
jgi:hypothetical protein